MFFKKKKKKNKRGKFTSDSYKKSSISRAQMEAINSAVLSKRRLFVFSESV